MLKVAMIKETDNFVPLCILGTNKQDVSQIKECIADAYRNNIPRWVVDAVTTVVHDTGDGNYVLTSWASDKDNFLMNPPSVCVVKVVDAPLYGKA